MFFRRAVLFAIKQRRWLVSLLLLFAVAGVALASRLDVSTGAETLLGSGNSMQRATERSHAEFGDEPVVVLVNQRLTDLVLTEDLGRLLGLEGCLAGKVPQGATPVGGVAGPCGQLAKRHLVKVTYGPATFINQSAQEIAARLQQANQLIKQAGSAKQAKALKQQYLQLALKYGISGAPSIDDPGFINQLVFNSQGETGIPKARFGFLFPSPDTAQIQVRLRADLNREDRRRAIALVRSATAMSQWKLSHGGSYTVTGVPVLIEGAADGMVKTLRVLLAFAVVVMALVLALCFRGRLRLLPLLLALCSVAILFGLVSLLGLSLTVAGIASMPILIGLAVDYGIQLQSSVERQVEEGVALESALLELARGAAPAVCCAAAATAASFLALLASPLPLVRGFAGLLVAGVALALAVALVGGVACRVLMDRLRFNPASLQLPSINLSFKHLDSILAFIARRARVILLAAVLLAGIGWVAESAVRVESDPRKLLAGSDPALQGVQRLDRAGAPSGTVDVLVSAKDVSDPAVLNWMVDYQERMLARFGYSESSGCAKAELCPGIPLKQLLGGGQTVNSKLLISNLPAYLTGAVFGQGNRTATVGFGLPLSSLKDQQSVVTQMRKALDPPPGVEAEVTGFTSIAATANAKVSDPWLRLATALVAALLAALVILVALRSLLWALLAVVPTVVASGWVGVVLYLTGVSLNPLSATLGALVIAISTEFSILIVMRYRRQCQLGESHDQALAAAYHQTASVAVVSALAATAGFAVLTVSNLPVIREFGAVVVVDLLVATVGALVLLPALLTVAQQRNWLGSANSG